LRQFAACREHLRRELGVAPDETTSALAEAIRTGLSRRSTTEAGSSGGTIAACSAREHNVAGDQIQAPAQVTPSHSEFRQLTVMACEMLPALVDRFDDDQPEKIEDCHRRCTEVIERHQGYVARCDGDGLLAYFGYPRAHERDAENCVRAALALKQLARQLNAGWGTVQQPCIGIASGIVTITEGPSRTGVSVLGEPLTLSSRLQALAKPGQIVVASSTRLLLGTLFDYQDLGSATLKGMPLPVSVAEVVGQSRLSSRFEALRPGHLTPFVGREEETELLLRRWRQAEAGEGSVVLLIGEPGIGKSRIVQNIIGHLADQPHRLWLLNCSPYYQESSLFPFIKEVERVAGFCDEDSDEQRLLKIEHEFGRGIKDPRKAASLLAQLLSIPTGDRYPRETLAPQQRKEKTLEALVQHIERLSETSRLLLVVEDVHWADPTSLELLDLIVERAQRSRKLVIMTARPEFVSPWAGRMRTIAVTLDRLPRRQSAAIVVGVAHGKRLPDSVISEIIDRADGVPLFVEELTKAVIESSQPAQKIPMTLHASLLARLDRLTAARDVVQVAAAIGRRFSYRLVGEIISMPAERLNEALAELVAAELIWCRGSPPEAEYTFKHALVQDAAYSTLRREPRRVLHGRIAGALERTFPDLANTQPELLAHHCNEAGLIERAATLWGRAGQFSLARSAIKEAAAQLARALSLLEAMPISPTLRQEQIKIQIAFANALMHTKGYAAPETRAALTQARMLVEHAEAIGEPPEDRLLLLSVLHGFWVASHVAFEGNAVRALAIEFMAIAQRQKAEFPLVLAHRVMGTSLLYLGDIEGGRRHLDQALSLYKPAEHRPLGTRFGQEAGVAVVSNRPLALWLLGHPEAAMKDADDAIRQAREIGQTATYLYALTRIAWVHLVIGNYDIALAQMEELSAITEQMEGSYWTAAATMLRGCFLALTGEGEAAIEMITSGIKNSRLTGSNLLRMPWYLSCLSDAEISIGQLDVARRYIGEAMEAATTTKESWQEPDLHRLAGDLAWRCADSSAALMHYDRALAVARQQKAKSWELRAATSLARLWCDKGKRRKAREVLAPVYGSFKEGFDTPDLREAKRLLAELN
jgi:class 3 adenylate cyclase/tetratricopeptide (TPR) repeat protein